MHGTSEASSVIFGLNPMWVAALLFLLTYAVVMSEKINRAIVALLAAGLMIVLGVINQEAAIRGIDFNTIGLLIGMMVIVAITRQSGIFPASPAFFNSWRSGRPSGSTPNRGASW